MKNFGLIMESWRGFKKTLSERTRKSEELGADFSQFRRRVELSKDKVWIFFDTETTGLKPEKDYNQVTQLAAIAVDTKNFQEGTEPEVIGEINIKINLSERTRGFMDWEKRKQAERAAAGEESKFKTIPQIFSMTGYGVPRNPRKRMRKGVPAEFKFHSMEEALTKFNEFMDKYPQRVLVAQNAPFDVAYLNEMYQRANMPVPDDAVLDTVSIFKKFLLPALKLFGEQSAQGTELAQGDARILKSLSATNKAGNPYYTVSLGKLIDAFNIENKGWHDALADVQMLMRVLRAVIIFLDSRPDLTALPAGNPDEKPAYGSSKPSDVPVTPQTPTENT